MNGKYVYGIVASDQETAFGVTRLGGLSEVYTIVHQGLGCVLSDYPGREFSSVSKEEVVRCLIAHQVVVEQVMRKQAVLPVKFGTVLATSREVRDLLSQGHSQFVDALAWIQDKVEVEVAATWDRAQVLREISDEKEIVRAREDLESRPSHQPMEQRIHLGKLVKALMDRRRDSYRERMMSFLKPIAVDVQPNAMVSDEMVMNVAFLVDRAHQEEFDSQVKRLNDLFHDQINFRIIGPLPPYSFATVKVTRPSAEKLEEARQLLHLGKVFSEPEIRKAYRHLAAEVHPDRKLGDELAKSKFAELHRASDLLIAYCRGQTESGAGLMIAIRRMEDEEVHHLHFSENLGSVAGAAYG